MTEPDLNTHGVRMTTGKHKNELITRVPVNYLLWMVNVGHSQAKLAEAEILRRGTVVPAIEVSGHAIDRASQSCLGKWEKYRNKGEGLHAWLCRMAAEAIANGKCVDDKVIYKTMKFVFELDVKWPVLKTVMPDKGDQK